MPAGRTSTFGAGTTFCVGTTFCTVTTLCAGTIGAGSTSCMRNACGALRWGITHVGPWAEQTWAAIGAVEAISPSRTRRKFLTILGPLPLLTVGAFMTDFPVLQRVLVRSTPLPKGFSDSTTTAATRTLRHHTTAPFGSTGPRESVSPSEAAQSSRSEDAERNPQPVAATSGKPVRGARR